MDKPVVYYRQLISVACGHITEKPVLVDQICQAQELEEIAAK